MNVDDTKKIYQSHKIVKFLLKNLHNNRKCTIFAIPNNTLYDMKCDEFHNLVRLNGWMKLRQSGSHVIYQKENRTYPVPYHKGKEIGKALEKKMRKEMGLQ